MNTLELLNRGEKSAAQIKLKLGESNVSGSDGRLIGGFSVGSITQTDYGYTGQRKEGYTGLMDYRARMYDPALGRFSQPDSIVSNAGDPQNFNRFSYVLNSPVKYTDPSGHSVDCAVGEVYCEAGKLNENKRASGLAMHYLWKATHRGATNFYSNLSSEEQKILGSGGWDEGSYNDFVSCGGCVSTSDALHDPATYIVGAVAGMGIAKAVVAFLGSAATGAASSDPQVCGNCGTIKPDLVRNPGSLRVDPDGVSVWCRNCVANGNTPLDPNGKYWIWNFDEFVDQAAKNNLPGPTYSAPPAGHFSTWAGAANTVFDTLNTWIRSGGKQVP